MNVVVCDDDEDDLNEVVNILYSIFVQNGINHELQIFISSKDLLEQVNEVDIAVLDISMDYMNGIELGRRLKSKFPDVKIIYTTNYEEYCLQAVNDIHAFSFLCKPIQRKDMENQILDLFSKFNQADDIEKTFYKVSNLEGDEIPILKIRLNDILYFEYVKSRRRIAIISADKRYEISYVMKNLIEELEAYGFAVNCRGNLVNLKHIVKIKGYNIYLNNGKTLTLAQKRSVEFKKKMNMFIHDNI